jgi:CO/xanthine dehydrogenase Mo-binding subunit
LALSRPKRSADRIEGPSKATGQMRYSYEHQDAVPGAPYGYVIGSAVAKGRIAGMDLVDAKAAPGVLAIAGLVGVVEIRATVVARQSIRVAFQARQCGQTRALQEVARAGGPVAEMPHAPASSARDSRA